MTERPAYRVQLTSPAVRSLAKLPPRIAEPLVAFIFGSLAENPKRRGKPLGRELTGLWSARRDEYRVIYQIDDDTVTVYVVDIGHRSSIYRAR